MGLCLVFPGAPVYIPLLPCGPTVQVKARPSKAAKRRQNRAHGVSHGSARETIKALKGRKKGAPYGRRAGAGPGGKISGSPEWTRARVTKKTAAVQVGNRSNPGISSAPIVGRNAQCHPRSSTKTSAARTSRATSAGDNPPAANNGKKPIWIASTAIATSQANRCSGAFTDFRKSNSFITLLGYTLGHVGTAALGCPGRA